MSSLSSTSRLNLGGYKMLLQILTPISGESNIFLLIEESDSQQGWFKRLHKLILDLGEEHS